MTDNLKDTRIRKCLFHTPDTNPFLLLLQTARKTHCTRIGGNYVSELHQAMNLRLSRVGVGPLAKKWSAMVARLASTLNFFSKYYFLRYDKLPVREERFVPDNQSVVDLSL